MESTSSLQEAKSSIATLGAAVQVNAIRGPMMIWPFDGPIGDAFLQYGEWAENEIGFLQQFVSEGDTVIDGGANIGSHTLAFARQVGATGRIVSIEASAEVAHLLRANVEANHLDHVTVLNVALGSDTEVYVPRINPGARFNVGSLQIAERAAFQNYVKTTTLDGLDVDQVALVKLDLEGSELVALRSATELLRRAQPAVFCEFNLLDEGIRLIQFMEEQGYKSYFVSAAAFNPVNFNGSDVNMFGVAREAGLLFLWRERPVPRQTSRVSVKALQSLADVAQCFFEMPRYGDRTSHDRVPTSVIEERNSAVVEIEHLRRQHEEAISALRSESLDERQQLKAEIEGLTRLRTADVSETSMLRERCSLLGDDILQARRALADIRQTVMARQLDHARSVLAGVASVQAPQPVEPSQVEFTPQPVSPPPTLKRRVVRRIRRTVGRALRYAIRA